MTFNLDFTITGRHIPYFVALDKGFYEEEGLDVEILPGTGAGPVFAQLVTGQADFTFSGLDGMIPTQEEAGVPLTALASIYAKAPQTIFFFEESGITEPQDLEGRTIAGGGSPVQLFPVFADATGTDASLVELAPTEPGALVQVLVTGQVDAMSTFIFTRAAIEANKPEGAVLNYFNYGDYGVENLSQGLLARSDYVAENPDIVRGFVQATMRGLEYAFANKAEAIDIGVEHIEGLDADIAAEELDILEELATSEASEEHCLGWIDEDAMAATLETVERVFELDIDNSPEDYYTNEFLECS